MRRRVPADPLCSGLLRLPHVHLTIVDGFADPRRRVTAMPAGVSSVAGSRRRWMLGSRRRWAHVCRGLPSTAVKERPAAGGVTSSLRIAESSMQARAGAFREPLPMERSRRRGSGDTGPYRRRRSEDAPAGAARVRARPRSQAGTAGADLTGACLSLCSSLNQMTNQGVTSCHVARTVVEVRYLFRRRAGCVGN